MVFQAGEVLMPLGKIGNLKRFSELFRSWLGITSRCPAATGLFREV